jgi:hypothetical protein
VSGKADKGKKGKGKKQGASVELDEQGLPVGPQLVSLHDHPSAAAKIRKAKAYGGLIAFILVAYGSTSKGANLPDALLRGLIAGVIGLHVTWLAAVIAARRILKAQTVALVEHALAQRRPGAGRS